MKTAGKITAQTPSTMPFGKYRPALDTNPIDLPDRTWPDRRIVRAPRWLSTDLRDGNQALVDPMDPQRKRKMFDQLVQMGFKEIEIGFPAASQTDFDFVRSLIENDAVPEDVTVSVLTQSRAELIERTIQSLIGFPRANVHLYNATAPLFREVVFRNDWPATIALAESGTRDVMAQAEKYLDDDTTFGFQYSPEVFVDTEIEKALEISERVSDIWEVGPDRELILNLPATVERATPNVYADQIEYMARNLTRRDHTTISVHPHNDRGSGVAAAELALLAGADRVEGCLFGQGERTGNVDLVTVALNLYTQGVDPELQIDDIDEVRRVYEYCTGMPVPARTPYAGDLVYTSFSGSHQDAIKKGFAAREAALAAGAKEDELAWQIPYLPIDPHDVGRTYEAVVRVNSQSGKGGVAYVMLNAFSLDLPRRLQVEFSRIVQRHTEAEGGEISQESLWKIFADAYLPTEAAPGLEPWGRFILGKTQVTADNVGASLQAELFDRGQQIILSAKGNGPIDAFVRALGERGFPIRILDYAEHALSMGEDAEAAAYVEVEVADQVVWGVGIDPSIARASYKAVISALNRALR